MGATYTGRVEGVDLVAAGQGDGDVELAGLLDLVLGPFALAGLFATFGLSVLAAVLPRGSLVVAIIVVAVVAAAAGYAKGRRVTGLEDEV